MRTISNELKASLERKTPAYKKTVEIYRRLWSGSAYVYDTVVDITDQVKEYSPIRWKFDSEAFNIWTLDNTALVFRNDRNQWKQGNTKGYFPAGYQIADSKIVVKFGAQLASGSFEALKSFTGYINTDPRYDSAGKTATITIYGGMAVFERNPAESISTLVTNELMGSDSGTVFTTDFNGVGQTKEFKLLRGTVLGTATEIKPATDYSASNQNMKALPLTITLVTGLTVGEKLWISYRYWYQGKTLEWLATQIMTLCGVTSYSISPAVFTTSIENILDFDSQANWDACTKINIDTVTSPGSFKVGLIDDFGDGDYTANPVWTVLYQGDSSVATVENSRLKLTSGAYGGNSLRLASTSTLGSWQFKAWPDPGVNFNSIKVWIMGGGNDYAGIPAEGYYVRCYRSSYGSTVSLRRSDPVSDETLITTGYLATINDTIRVSRGAGGAFEMFINEVSVGTATNNIWTTSTGIYVVTRDSISSAAVQWFTNLYFWPAGTTPGTGVLTSPVQDAGVNITSFGIVDTTSTLNGGTVTIETYSSGTSDFSTDNDPAGWVQINGSGQIISIVKRYLKFRVTAVIRYMDMPVTPVIDRIKLKYYTSTTLIDLVNLTGMTSKQVLEELAKWPAYEIGMTPDERFIYRPRSTALSAVMELRSGTNIEKLYNISPGIDRVKNRITADFGIYRRIADASADASPDSIDDYGVREYTISSSQLLPPENANLAFAVAPSVLVYSKLARRRCQVDTMFLPQLELGDKVAVYHAEDTALRRWKWGDTDVVLGQADMEYYDEAELENRYNFWGVNMRIEGISLDPNTFKTTLDLTEIK